MMPLCSLQIFCYCMKKTLGDGGLCFGECFLVSFEFKSTTVVWFQYLHHEVVEGNAVSFVCLSVMIFCVYFMSCCLQPSQSAWAIPRLSLHRFCLVVCVCGFFFPLLFSLSCVFCFLPHIQLQFFSHMFLLQVVCQSAANQYGSSQHSCPLEYFSFYKKFYDCPSWDISKQSPYRFCCVLFLPCFTECIA